MNATTTAQSIRVADTTTGNASSFFKKVKKADSVHNGEKRPDLKWTYQAVTPETIRECTDSETASALAVIVNDALEKFGKQQLLEKSEDWEFAPSEDTVNVAALYKELTTATTRSRTVTKETLAAAGEQYKFWAIDLLGKKESQGSAGQNVIAAKLAPIAANPEALEVMKGNIVTMLEAVADAAEKDMSVNAKLEQHYPVFEWLIGECDKLIDSGSQDISEML